MQLPNGGITTAMRVRTPPPRLAQCPDCKRWRLENASGRGCLPGGAKRWGYYNPGNNLVVESEAAQ